MPPPKRRPPPNVIHESWPTDGTERLTPMGNIEQIGRFLRGLAGRGNGRARRAKVVAWVILLAVVTPLVLGAVGIINQIVK